MKTGVVLEVKNGKATIIEAGGTFVTVKAKPEWRKGDVVSVRKSSAGGLGMRTLAAAAACFVVALAAGGYNLWNEPASLVSVDVNPSIELQVNRFDRVVAAKPYNREAGELLDSAGIDNRRVDEALALLFENGLETYLEKSPYITYAVHSDDSRREDGLLALLEEATGELLAQYPGAGNATVDYYPVDAELVESAHTHHVTAGKYKTIMELLQLAPEVQVEEYTHCGIGEIHQEIERCSGHGEGDGGHMEEHGHHGGGD